MIAATEPSIFLRLWRKLVAKQKIESRADPCPPTWAGSAEAAIAEGLAMRQKTAPTAPSWDTTVRGGVFIPDFVPSQPTSVGAGGVEAVRTAAR